MTQTRSRLRHWERCESKACRTSYSECDLCGGHDDREDEHQAEQRDPARRIAVPTVAGSIATVAGYSRLVSEGRRSPLDSQRLWRDKA